MEPFLTVSAAAIALLILATMAALPWFVEDGGPAEQPLPSDG